MTSRQQHQPAGWRPAR